MNNRLPITLHLPADLIEYFGNTKPDNVSFSSHIAWNLNNIRMREKGYKPKKAFRRIQRRTEDFNKTI